MDMLKKNGVNIKKTHFIVYYKEAPIDFVKTVAEQAENYYDEISHNLGFVRYRYWLSNDRAQIFIFDDAKAFVEKGGQTHWASGVVLTRAKIIRTFPAAHLLSRTIEWRGVRYRMVSPSETTVLDD